ncbi:MAG: NADH-quinone oxidoreductase subunit J [Candidatus Micrarchaeaceae archaeon]
MIEIISFIIVSFVMLISSIMIFYQKSIMRAVILLTMTFAFSSIIFFILNQNFIALLQLFIFVGGMSTYLIVAVSSEYKKINKIEFGKICIIAVIIFIAIFLSLIGIANNNSINTSNMTSYFAYAFQSYYPIIYASIVMLFLTSIGSILIIRKYVKLII